MIVLLVASLSVGMPARAATTYYVDSAASCPGSGTSGSPYCNFDTINTTTFVQGDQILLKRGSQWNQQLIIQGSGTSGSHATLADYGTGNKPKIIRSGGTDTAIWMWDASYWDVSNIEVGNAQTGIGVYYTGTNTGTGLTFTGIYAHDILGQHGSTRGVLDAATTNGSSTITSSTMNFTANDVGSWVHDETGSSIPANTYISSVTNSTTAVMSANATATTSGAKMWVQRAFYDGATTTSSTTLTSSTASFTSQDVGREVFASYWDGSQWVSCCLASKTYIASVSSSTTAVLSAAATETRTSLRVNVGAASVCQTTSSGTYNVQWASALTINGCDASGRAQGGVASDILIEDFEVTDSLMPMVLAGVDDALVRDLSFHDNDGGGGVVDCAWSVFIYNSKNISIQDSVITNDSSCYTNNGTAAVIAATSAYVNFTNNIVNGVPNTSSYDESGFDYDRETDNIKVRNNTFSNNYGNGVEILAGATASDYQTNIEVSGNTFYFNGNNDMTNDYIGWGAIRRYGNAVTPSGTISNNLFQEPKGFNSSQGSGDFSGFTFSGNRVFDTTQTAYNKLVAFQYATQGVLGYYYQYRTCSTCSWTNLSTYSGGVWSNGGGSTDPQISQFTMQPGSSGSCTTSNPCDVAVMWKAPSSGKVAVRSRVLESDTSCGDGVLARVTKTSGGSTSNLWPASGDTTVSNESNPIAGSAADLDDVSVSTNDEIRFVVNMNTGASCDLTSWAPSIIYSADTAYSWNYNTAGAMEGWTVYSGSWSVASGKLSNTCGTCPGSIISPAYLGLDGSTFDQVKVTLTNNSGSSRTGQIWYITTTDTTWTLTKTVSVPNGTSTVTFDMSGETWASSTVMQFSFKPIDSAHTVDIDSISITK